MGCQGGLLLLLDNLFVDSKTSRLTWHFQRGGGQPPSSAQGAVADQGGEGSPLEGGRELPQLVEEATSPLRAGAPVWQKPPLKWRPVTAAAEQGWHVRGIQKGYEAGMELLQPGAGGCGVECAVSAAAGKEGAPQAQVGVRLQPAAG